MTDVDAAVVGAGAVGLACAAELAAAGLSVVVLERHEAPGQETSSRNSQVVHAGIYYPPGSLKASLSVSGNRSLSAWCVAHDVPFRRLGKYVVAVEPEEEGRVAEVVERARACGAEAVAPVPLARFRSEEPHVKAVAAAFSPSTGILDVHGLFRSLRVRAEEHGAAFAFRHELTAVQPSGGGYELVARGAGGEEAVLSASRVVNSAGLDADTVASLAGIDVDAAGYRLHWCQGRYFRIRSSRRSLARHLVYPVAPERSAGLGVHVTLDLDGELKLGPDTEYLATREKSYAVRDDLRAAFFAAASRYLPELTPDDLAPDLAGIRPKLSGPGEGFRDFVIAEESGRGLPGWVNLVGIESPGLTSCLEIALRVRRLLGV